MSILPSAPLDLNLELNKKSKNDFSYTNKSFAFDFEKGEFIIQDGKIKEVSGIKALKIWIEKILRTEKFKFKIYQEADYGTLLKDLILGSKLPIDFSMLEIKREVTEAILKNKLIRELDNWNIQQDHMTLIISFRVILQNGDNFKNEVNINAYT